MKCVHYADGYRYQLRAPYAGLFPELADPSRAPISTDWIELDPDGTLRIRAGYASDGASGPTYDSKSSMRGAFVHDAGYQLLRMGLLAPEMRAPIDKLFHRLCREDGMLPPRAWLWYHAVRIFAKPAADPALVSPDQHAPTDTCTE